MDDGRVIERGAHSELMATRGVYHAMVMRRMESHTDDDEAVLR
jgi:ABC-type multidrug transport system fused ATPase/permease subunit